MNSNSSSMPPATGGRALVLGGGGSTGNAWLIGVIAGLADSGADMTATDCTIGTSAGATAAAQLAGSTPAELYAATLVVPPARPGTPAPPSTSARPASDGERPPRTSTVSHLDRTNAIIAAAADPAAMRRGIGADAIELAKGNGDAGQARWRSTVAARLASHEWPERRLLLTAVDAETGEGVVLDRDSGVDLVDAVAASTSGFAAYRLGGRWLIDGGYRRGENADLAAGCRRVVVLAPLGGRTRMPLAWRMHLTAQAEELRAAGSSVEVLVPDPADEHLFGANAMDLSSRPAAARAGHAQGLAVAEHLATLWL